MFDYEYERKNHFQSIENYKNLITKKREEIEELDTIIDSLTASLVKRIRSIQTPFLLEILKAAFKEQNATKKSERKNYEYIKNKLIKECIAESRQKDVKLTSMVSCGYEGYAINFVFTYKKITFEIKIPIPEKATPDNLWYMSYGKYSASYQKSSACWEQIVESYKLEDIASALEQFFIEQEGNFI